MNIEDLTELEPQEGEPYERRSQFVYDNYLEPWAQEGELYSQTDILTYLRQVGASEQLVQAGLGRLAVVDGKGSTSIQRALRNLWRNGMIRKFCKGFYSPTAGGRPYMVRWMIRW